MTQEDQFENMLRAIWDDDNDPDTADDPAAGAEKKCTVTVPSEMNGKRLDVILSELLED